jgi:hypothetical protein
MTGSSPAGAAGSSSSPRFSATPLEHLVRVHTVGTSNQRHTRTRLKCKLRNPPLLRRRSEPARAAPGSCFLLINHEHIVALKPELMPEGNLGRLQMKRTKES